MSVATAIPAPASRSADPHIPAAEVLRRWPSLSRMKLYRLCTLGEVRTQLIPGIPPRYNVRDIERVMSAQGA